MAQLTLDLPDAAMEELRAEAKRAGMSPEDWATSLLTNPFAADNVVPDDVELNEAEVTELRSRQSDGVVGIPLDEVMDRIRARHRAEFGEDSWPKADDVRS